MIKLGAYKISTTGVTLVQDESLYTLIDLHNYAAMAVLLLDTNSNMMVTSSSDENENDENDEEEEIVNEDGSKANTFGGLIVQLTATLLIK